MPISQNNQIFSLVKSLTKAEKRNFRSYAKRIQNDGNLLFLKLFDTLDKQKEIDEAGLLQSLKLTNKAQFSNAKRHLYSQIVSSLRMLHKEKRANFKVREYIDFAYILYGKGLYIQALKFLSKANNLAKKHHLTYMQLTIIEFKKKIESRHITRSGINKAETLIEESKLIQNNAAHLVTLSNLRIRMHAKYLEHGHVRSKAEAQQIKAYYHEQIDPINLSDLGMMATIYYVQSRVWYNYILLDFDSCSKYAKQWIAVLESNPSLIERDVDLYMRGYHYLLTTAYHTRKKKVHADYLVKFETFRKDTYGKLNHNSQILSFLYVHTGRLDNIILNGTFQHADDIINRSILRIKKYRYKLDDHRVMVFYYKFAWIYLGNNNPSKAIFYLNKIINNKLKKLREDLQNYARILQMMCHYELGNVDILKYIINNYSSYSENNKELNNFIKNATKLFLELRSKGLMDHKEVFKNYLKIFNSLKRDPYEKRAFVYLDITSWIESKIRGISLNEIINKRNT